MPKRRLAIVVKYFPPYPRISGILTYVSLLAAEMGREHEIHVVTSAIPGDEPLDEVTDDCTVHRVGAPFPLTSGLRVRSLRPDVVLTVSGIYDLRIAGAYFAPGRLLAGRSPEHHLYQATWPASPPGRLFRLFSGRYRSVLVASDGISEQFEAAGLQAATVAPAVDVSRLRRSRRPPGERPLRVGFVNHLNMVKGADRASSVISQLAASSPGMEFVIAGVGDLEPQLRAAHGDDPRVRFSGFLPEAERLEVLASCDVMLLPFRQAASVLGVSQTALEVMALRNVVIGTDTGSLSAAIENGRNGILVDPDGDVVASMVAAVQQLERDRASMERLRDHAASDAQERWDIRRRAQEVPQMLGLTRT
jgi:glycosyltransferase involved in cell wall biosynthesis